MDFESYQELIDMVRNTSPGVTVLISFVPNVTDDTSNEAYPTMIVTNGTDPALIQAMTQMLSENE